MTKTYPVYLNVRIGDEHRAALRQIQRAYRLPSMSETVRATLLQVASERHLADAGETSTKEIKHE